MKTGRILLISLPFLFLTVLLAGCTQTPSTPNALQPHSAAASRIASLWWVMLVLALITYLITMGLLAFALWRKRYRRPDDDGVQRDWLRGQGQKLVLGGGVILPTVVLFIVYGFTLSTLSALNEQTSHDPVIIEVIGHQWWWEIHYPQQQFRTANEIHIPVGVPVQLHLTSDDVIHSF